jgi:hypothetical protein
MRIVQIYEAHSLLARHSIENRSDACYLLIEEYLKFEGKFAVDCKITISLLLQFFKTLF